MKGSSQSKMTWTVSLQPGFCVHPLSDWVEGIRIGTKQSQNSDNTSMMVQLTTEVPRGIVSVYSSAIAVRH